MNCPYDEFCQRLRQMGKPAAATAFEVLKKEVGSPVLLMGLFSRAQIAAMESFEENRKQAEAEVEVHVMPASELLKGKFGAILKQILEGDCDCDDCKKARQESAGPNIDMSKLEELVKKHRNN